MREIGDPWLSLGLDAVRLGIEAQQVAALRVCRLAAAGPLPDEYQLMISEKIAGFGEAAIAVALATLLGGDAPTALRAGLGELHRRVTANKLRLARS